jgi:hypothetical protein
VTAQPCSARSFKQRPLARLNITWRGAESDRAARPASWPERVGRAYSRAVHRAARLAARAAALVQVRVTEWALAAGVSPRAQRALRVAFELWGIIVEAAEVLLLVRARPPGAGEEDYAYAPATHEYSLWSSSHAAVLQVKRRFFPPARPPSPHPPFLIVIERIILSAASAWAGAGGAGAGPDARGAHKGARGRRRAVLAVSAGAGRGGAGAYGAGGGGRVRRTPPPFPPVQTGHVSSLPPY